MPESIIVSIDIKFRQCVNSTPSRTPCAKAKLTQGKKKVYSRKKNRNEMR